MATTKPSFRFERVLEKVDESRFFLSLMEGHRSTPREFCYCVSAFLSAFKSVFERLRSTVGDKKLQSRAASAISALRESQPDVGFLVKARNAEVHGEGEKIEFVWQAPSFTPERWRSRFNPPWARFESRFDPPWGRAEGHPQVVWKFSRRRATDLITICKNSLQALEDMIQDLANEVSNGSGVGIPC